METFEMTVSNNISRKVTNKDINSNCARLGCPNRGIHLLKVVYIDRKGRFCDLHRTELLNEGIVEQIKDERTDAVC